MPSPTNRTRTTLRRAGRAVASTRTRAVLSFGMILGLGTVGTLAVWSDNAAATSGTFSTGTVDLQVNNAKAYEFSTLAMSDMLPGESIAATLKVQNKSSMAVRYSISASTPASTPQLANFVSVDVYSSPTPSNNTVSGQRVGSCPGAIIGRTTLVPGSASEVLADRGLLAAEGGAEDLCFVAKLSTTANSAVQGQTLPRIVLDFTTTGS